MEQPPKLKGEHTRHMEDRQITLTINLLKEMIRTQIDEANPYHSGKNNKEGGRFVSKANAIKSGGTYSFTDNAKDDIGEDGEHTAPARGAVTAKGKVKPYFGAMGNTDKACGRLYKNGSKKPKSRRCRDYDTKAKYGQTNEQNSPRTLSSSDMTYIKELIKAEIAQARQASGRKGNPCSWHQVLQGIRDIQIASQPSKGKHYE